MIAVVKQSIPNVARQTRQEDISNCQAQAKMQSIGLPRLCPLSAVTQIDRQSKLLTVCFYLVYE